MGSLRDKVEKRFETIAHILYRHRIKTLLILFILSFSIISQLPKITIDTSTEGFLHETDPTLLSYNKFRDQFGRDEMIVVAIKAPDIFDLDFLSKLKQLHYDLSDNVPYIDDITSLINARNTRGQEDELIVDDLLETWPRTPDALATIEKWAMENEMYKNLLISEDGKFTTIVIQTQTYKGQDGEIDVLAGFEEGFSEDASPENREYLTDAENSEAVARTTQIVDKYRSPDFEIYLAGSPVVTDYLKRAMMKDMRKFMAPGPAGNHALFVFNVSPSGRRFAACPGCCFFPAGNPWVDGHCRESH